MDIGGGKLINYGGIICTLCFPWKVLLENNFGKIFSSTLRVLLLVWLEKIKFMGK